MLGLALAALGWPTAAGAQVYCAGTEAPGAYGTGSSPYVSFTPMGYSIYGGFASYPGGFISGTPPSNYSINPYSSGCVPTGRYSGSPYTYASDTYNPYSFWGALQAASPYSSAMSISGSYGITPTGGATGSSAAYPYVPYGTMSYQPTSWSPYTGFASYPGGMASGYLGATAGVYGSYVPQTAYGNVANYGGYSSYVPQTAYGNVPNYGGYQGSWGSGGAVSYPGLSTLLTWGCSGGRC